MSATKPKNKSENKTEKQLAAEKEQFGKQQLNSISKSLTSSETPLKEKYARNIIMGTHHEGGATTFWSYILNLPLSSNAIISWKFCYMLHKVLRDGHPNAVRDSHRYCRNVKDMGVLWGNLHDRYGHIVALSAKFLCLKMEFHVKHKVIPGNLEAKDETLEREAGTDVNKIFDVTQELLDYLEAALKMSETVWRQLDANAGKSTTPAGQCRLGPLIPVILDCSWLYHHSVKLLFKLHSRVSADSLLGHRERFRDLFNSLTKFFDRARETEFFKKVIQIPDLPDSPPNFLRASALAEYIQPVVVMPNQEPYEEVEAEPQPDYSLAAQMPQQPYSNLFSQLGPPDAGLHQRRSPSPGLTEADSLRVELDAIKPELLLLKTEAQRCVTQLKSQVNRLEAELEEQRTHKQMALVDNEHLRMEMGALRQATAAIPGVQAGYQEADGRAQAAELRFCQLKERHAELVTSHAELQKKNAEIVRVLSNAKQTQEDLSMAKQQMANEMDQLRQENRLKLDQQKQEIDRLNKELLEQTAALGDVHGALDNKERAVSQLNNAVQGLQTEREDLLRCLREKEGEVSSLQQQAQLQRSSMEQERDRSAEEIARLKQQLQQQFAINAEQRAEIDKLKRELEQSRAEVSRANSALQNKEMTSSQMNSALMGLQAERDGLLGSLRDKDAELSSQRQQAQLRHSSLEQDKDRTAGEMASLRLQLQQQATREGELTRKLQEEQFCLLQCAVVEAEGIILDAVSKLDDPIHVRCICSPDYLVNRAEITLGSLDKMQQSHVVYLGNMDDASGLLRAVTQFSHLAADTIVNGGATAHTAPTDQADRLTDSCREASTHCLQFLHELKSRATLHRADPTPIHYIMQRILAMGKDLCPKGQDVLKEELGDIVDKEMTATSTAIEEAVLRMDEILNQARKDTSGVKLEVNQSILGSCSDLMKAIHMLVTASTDLQKDIVESSRGAATVKEFYAKNSRWTEGLISASKAVGWGATQMLDSADKVVTSGGKGGKYEELIVCSHEIAASTAQLVAASKVKADRNNKKLLTLQHASRHVNDMAAVVVTSTKHGQRQITERDPMDFSGISLIKVKTQEMESQVKVLELENQLDQERVRLGELRKKHYQLAGTPDGEVEGQDDDDGEDSFPPPPPPTLLPPSSLLTQSFSSALPYLNTQTQAYSQPSTQSYSQPELYSETKPYSEPQPYSQSQTSLQTKPYSEPQPYSQSQTSLQTKPYSEPQPYSQSQTSLQTKAYSEPQPYSQSQTSLQTKPYSEPQPYSQSQTSLQTKPYSEPQPYSQSQTSSQTKPYSQLDSYSLSQTQSYTPSHYSQNQSYPQHQPYSQSQPYINTNPFSQAQSLSQPLSQSLPLPNNLVELTKPPHTSKKPSIFQKTGNLFSKFRKSEPTSGES